MKNNLFLCVIAAATICVLIACSTQKKVTKADFESIQMGLSQKKVEDKLGKAVIIIKDEAKISKLIKVDLNKINEISAKDPKRLSTFVGEDDLSNLQIQMTNLINGEKVEVFQYEIADGGTENLYLINGIVILKSFN
jgi:hypothetical protein